MCSSSVTITRRASTQPAASPCDVSAAATMRLLSDFADGGDRVEPARRHFAQHAERADDALELVELAIDERLDRRRARAASVMTPRDLEVPRAQRRARARARLRRRRRRPRPRRRAADRSRRRARTRRRPARASRALSAESPPAAPRARWRSGARSRRRSATDVPPNFMTITASSPSAFISSAFRIDAPAAPRTVLWPSATNLCESTGHGAHAADRDRHAVAEIDVEPRLRPIRLVHHDDRRIGRGRQLQLLRPAAKRAHRLDDVVDRRRRVERRPTPSSCGRRSPARD